MQLIGEIPGQPDKRRWICLVALEAKRRGLLGMPGRKHVQCLIYKAFKSNVKKAIDE